MSCSPRQNNFWTILNHFPKWNRNKTKRELLLLWVTWKTWNGICNYGCVYEWLRWTSVTYFTDEPSKPLTNETYPRRSSNEFNFAKANKFRLFYRGGRLTCIGPAQHYAKPFIYNLKLREKKIIVLKALFVCCWWSTWYNCVKNPPKQTSFFLI